MPQDQEVDQEIELLVLASDGLWDVVANEVNPFNAARPLDFCSNFNLCINEHVSINSDDVKIFEE